LRDLQQRQSGRGNGQHDLGLAFVPEQHRSDEHRQEPAAEDAAARPVLKARRVMTTIDTSASSASSAVSAINGGGKPASASEQTDRFLKLLVTQMQNQDPLNPMDNAQITTQMAQISTVSGVDKLNQTLNTMSSSFL